MSANGTGVRPSRPNPHTVRVKLMARATRPRRHGVALGKGSQADGTWSTSDEAGAGRDGDLMGAHLGEEGSGPLRSSSRYQDDLSSWYFRVDAPPYVAACGPSQLEAFLNIENGDVHVPSTSHRGASTTRLVS